MGQLMIAVLTISLALVGVAGSTGYYLGKQQADDCSAELRMAWQVADYEAGRAIAVCQAIPVDVAQALDLQECGDL